MKNIFVFTLMLSSGFSLFSMNENNAAYCVSQEVFNPSNPKEVFNPTYYVSVIVDAISRGNLESAIYWIKNNISKDDLNKLYRFDVTEVWRVEMIRDIMTQKKTLEGYSIVHMAVYYGCWEIISVLYECGADLWIKASDKEKEIVPAQLAFNKKDWKSLEALFESQPKGQKEARNLFISLIGKPYSGL